MTEPRDYMRRALRIALKGRGKVSPNPLVGAVLVRRGQIVGEGAHLQVGGPHAEINAFAQAGTTSMIMNLVANDLNEMLDRMEEFATGVVPLV